MMYQTNTHATVKPPPLKGVERFARQFGDRFIVIERRRDLRNRSEFIREERTYTREEVIANFPEIVF